jgi:glucose/mannose-6-phosphate isomerase
MMRDAILNFPEQFAYEPAVENAGALEWRKTCIVAGMGGSHLAADLLLAWKPGIDVVVHSDYGLPAFAEDRLKTSFLIASSYSGNTEETLDAYGSAKRRGIPVAAMATGGVLLERAKADRVGYVRLPSAGIQPRSAVGFSFRALLACMGDRDGLDVSSRLAGVLRPARSEEDGKNIAARLQGRIPLIYVSSRNRAVGYIWKIKCNETGKTPAFYNVIPEANHNEMTGFDTGVAGKGRVDRAAPMEKGAADLFYAFFFVDSEDDERVQKRMAHMNDIYRSRGIPSEQVFFTGGERLERMASSIVLADWVALHTARMSGADPENVPMVEEFKRRMSASWSDGAGEGAGNIDIVL